MSIIHAPHPRQGPYVLVTLSPSFQGQPVPKSMLCLLYLEWLSLNAFLLQTL